ncbi:hypothetical protein ACFQU2_14975 [Siccirubricoccus deserti]
MGGAATRRRFRPAALPLRPADALHCRGAGTTGADRWAPRAPPCRPRALPAPTRRPAGHGPAYDPGQFLLIAAALIAFGLALRRGVPTAQRALRETGQTITRVLPLLLVALPMAAFLAELIPPDVAAGWLGPESGLPGIAIASLAGGFIPGGPFVSFPLVLTFIKAGPAGRRW